MNIIPITQGRVLSHFTALMTGLIRCRKIGLDSLTIYVRYRDGQGTTSGKCRVGHVNETHQLQRYTQCHT